MKKFLIQLIVALAFAVIWSVGYEYFILGFIGAHIAGEMYDRLTI